MTQKTLVLTAYNDPGHGWLKVPCKLLLKLNLVEAISGFSYLYGTHAYLEEDRDAGLCIRALREAGYEVTIRDQTARVRSSPIRDYAAYTPAACRERAERPRPAPGVLALYGGVTYTLLHSLNRKGWEVQNPTGVTLRMTSRQLAQARLRAP